MNFNSFGFWDVALTKLAVFFATLFLIGIWPDFADWATETSWLWFLIIALLASIKPMMTFLRK